MGFIIHIPISKAFILSFTFMPGDIIKAIIASLIGAAILNHSRFKTLIQCKKIIIKLMRRYLCRK